MKKLNTLIVPAALLALASVSGCNDHQVRRTGMPVIDRWMSPAPSMQRGPMMQRGPIEYAEPPEAIPPSPVPAPPPPSALLRPQPSTIPQLPNFPRLDDPRQEPLQDTYFQDEAGHTPLLIR